MFKYSFQKKIYPNKLICNETMYDVYVVDKRYIISEFDVILDKDKKIDKVIITKGKHPNCDPQTGEFCIPEYLRELQFTQKSFTMIKEMFKIFNFESAYYLPWSAIEYSNQQED
jgi:hypothetical protein